jgi:hypothetical protein
MDHEILKKRIKPDKLSSKDLEPEEKMWKTK